MIEFSVTDKGPGMKEEVLTRLYEAFFSTKAEGMGIGLSLCRSIIESHRGQDAGPEPLQWFSTVTGCRFAFTLPVDLTQRTELLNGARSPRMKLLPPTPTPLPHEPDSQERYRLRGR